MYYIRQKQFNFLFLIHKIVRIQCGRAGSNTNTGLKTQHVTSRALRLAAAHNRGCSEKWSFNSFLGRVLVKTVTCFEGFLSAVVNAEVV